MLWKMTLNGLYDYGQIRNDDLFEDMILPDHLDKEVVLNSILIKCGELPVMWADYPFMKNQIRVWFKRKKPIFDKMVELREAEFNPLYNYDRFEEYKDSESENENYNDSESTSNNTTQNSTDVNKLSAYDSNEFSNNSQDTLGASTNSNNSRNLNHLGNINKEFNHSAHLFGNIGVTTSVDMLTQAADEWYSRDIPEMIAEEFKCDFCIGLYC